MSKAKRKKTATPAATDATLDEAPRTASEAILTENISPAADAEGSPQHDGGDSPQHNVYAEGREALAELCKNTKRDLPTWLKLGRSFVKARTDAMRNANTNKPEGKTYCKALNKILKHEGLHSVESGQRRDLFRIMEHQSEIGEFLETRDPSERILNNPTAIVRAWRKTTAGNDALVRERRQLGNPRRRTQANLLRENEQLTARIAEVEEERDQLKREATPDFGGPRLVAIVRGGPVRADDLCDLTLDEWTAFASRIRQLMDEREEPALMRRVN
jgi:hypothetical protein